MFDKLIFASRRYDEINIKLTDPTVVSDNEQYKALMKEYTALTPIVEKYNEYLSAQNDIKEAQELLEESDDRELKEMATEQLLEAKRSFEVLKDELRILLLPKDPNDQKNVIVEIRGGRRRGSGTFCTFTLSNVFNVCRVEGIPC